MRRNVAAFRRRFLAVPVALALGLSIAALAPPAAAAQGDLLLAATSDTGVKGKGNSSAGSLSADGTTVAFSSTANNLDAADADAVNDIYVKDLATGDIVLASTSDTGVKGNGPSTFPVLSADGMTVAFTSAATNLDPGDTDAMTDVYVKDLATGDIVLASTADSGGKGNGASSDASLSADGRVVSFQSGATNLDPGDLDATGDVYVKDLTTGDIVLASSSSAGIKGDAGSWGPSLSADGQAVAFVSSAKNLDPADSDVSYYDIYVKDMATGTLHLASASDAGIDGDGSSLSPSLSGDGTVVAFQSQARNFDPADTRDDDDVYVKNIVTGDITPGCTYEDGSMASGISVSPSLSADGTRVAMLSTAVGLDPADTNDLRDAYVKDLVGGEILLASISATGEKSGKQVNESVISADGSTVAFSTPGQGLDPADTDKFTDVYVKSAADTIAPTVLATTPLDDAAGVAVFASPTATFDEPVTGVTSTSFTLTSADGSVIPATVTYDPDTLVARLDPLGDLAQDTRYTASLIGGADDIRDLAGNPLATVSWTYLTGPRPTLTKRTPDIDATGVTLTDNVTAKFREPVTGVSGSSFKLNGPAGRVPAVVSYDPGTRTATLNPKADLEQDTRYTVTLTGGTTAIRDIAGNPMTNTSWSFVTGPRPIITTTTPSAGATNVSRTANVTATASEPVVGVSYTTFTLENATTGAPVTAAISRNGSTNEWILNPSATLAANTTYTVTLTGGTTLIRDVAGNPLVTTSWSFTTGP